MGITASSLNLTDFDIERECCCCCCRSVSIFHSENFLFSSSVRRRESLFFINFTHSSTLSSSSSSGVLQKATTRDENKRLTFPFCFLLLMNKQRYLRIVTTSSRPLRFRRYTKGSNNSIKNTKDTSAKTNC